MQELMSDICFIGHGLMATFPLLFGGIFVGVSLGLLFAVLRYKKIAVTLINGLISILRGTPLILQISFVYFTTPSLFGIKLGIISAGIITFGLQSSAYFCEILRAGIESLPKGQFEAAKTLKIPSFYMWKDIILPQVIQNIFPALINQVITQLKDTALISTIGGMDLMRTSQVLAAEQFTYFMPLCIAGVYYYGWVVFIEYLSKKVEQRGPYAQHS